MPGLIPWRLKVIDGVAYMIGYEGGENILRRGEEIYLIGRRNLNETGNYDLDMDELPPAQQAQKYLVEYPFEPKRRSF
ncbi:hypothetical protein [Sorangium sp. So ce1078]|uniref:hypothetical protein n=1 Tax=Sorangium sp. So ce1078 TaxID=3133329 RepID=UPI003F60D2A9